MSRRVSDAQLRAQAKYDKENTIGIYLKLNKVTDADVIDQLHKVDNRQGYIKELIREDIRRDKATQGGGRQSGGGWQ